MIYRDPTTHLLFDIRHMNSDRLIFFQSSGVFFFYRVCQGVCRCGRHRTVSQCGRLGILRLVELVSHL